MDDFRPAIIGDLAQIGTFQFYLDDPPAVSPGDLQGGVCRGASRLWPVVPADFEQVIESFALTDVVGHEQDQFAIEIVALLGTQTCMQGYEPVIEIIRILDPWICMQFFAHFASLDSTGGADYRVPHSL
jgi:hypothetical protein